MLHCLTISSVLCVLPACMSTLLLCLISEVTRKVFVESLELELKNHLSSPVFIFSNVTFPRSFAQQGLYCLVVGTMIRLYLTICLIVNNKEFKILKCGDLHKLTGYLLIMLVALESNFWTTKSGMCWCMSLSLVPKK